MKRAWGGKRDWDGSCCGLWSNFRWLKGSRIIWHTIAQLGKWITNHNNSRPSLSSPPCPFINIKALLAYRSISIAFLCIYQSFLPIHNAQFQATRVRAFCDCDQTSTRVRFSGPINGAVPRSINNSNSWNTLCIRLTRHYESSLPHFMIQNGGTVSMFPVSVF